MTLDSAQLKARISDGASKYILIALIYYPVTVPTQKMISVGSKVIPAITRHFFKIFFTHTNRMRERRNRKSQNTVTSSSSSSLFVFIRLREIVSSLPLCPCTAESDDSDSGLILATNLKTEERNKGPTKTATLSSVK